MSEETFEIISRFLAGEASPEDILRLSDWLNQDEKNMLRLKQLRKFWDTPARIGNLQNAGDAFEKFSIRLDSPAIKKPVRSRTWTWTWTWMIPAAAVAVLLVMASVFFLTREEQPAIEYYSYNCINGVDRIVLPDSSTVYLNKGGKVTYASNYEENRRVDLSGEAYFDVVKASGLFTVHAGNGAYIEVLGTRFNVQVSGEKHRIITTLEEGSVRFVKGEQQILLAPDEQLIYNVNKTDYDIRQVDADLYTAWKEYTYKYNGITMQELCNELEKIYRVKIGLGSRLKDVKISGAFEYRHDLEQVLDVMKKRMQFEWKREGNEVLIQ